MELKINNETYEVSDERPFRPLLWVLRDELGLTGTKFGCGAGICGRVRGRAGPELHHPRRAAAGAFRPPRLRRADGQDQFGAAGDVALEWNRIRTGAR